MRSTFLLAAAAALLPCGLKASEKVNPVNRRSPTEKIATTTPLEAIGFDLSQVRLLDGPLKHAQDLDRDYLMMLDANRMLHCFRVNAGLPSSAKPLGGWEEPKSEVRGHFVGHYLSACSMMAAATEDPATAEKLRLKANYIADEMAKCQKVIGTGYLSAFPESFIDRVATGQPVWAPWYTLHKIMAGLEDNYVYCGNKTSLQTAKWMGDWVKSRFDKMTDAQVQRMLNNEQGGMNEAMANLYALTGERKYLEVSLRFNHHAIIDPLSKHVDPLDGVHANTQIPKIIGTARQYELTGTGDLHTVADYFWNVVTHERSYVIGGNSDGEMFSPKAHLSHAFGPSTTETCNTYNMLKLTRHLFEWNPNSTYTDYYERALFNHILASQDPDSGMMCYYVPLRAGSKREYNTPNDSFWCCTGTGVENHSRYGEMIYSHDGGQNLWVNLFVASKLNFSQRGIELTQQTRFPDQEHSRLELTLKRPSRLTIRIRRPEWCENGFELTLNNKTIPPQIEHGYAVIERTWKTGDVIEIALPMKIHTEGFADNPDRFAFLYGPLVLCTALNSNTSDMPALISQAKPQSLVSALKPAGNQSFLADPSLFRTPRPDDPAVMFTPFYKSAHNRYMVYMDLFTEEQWQQKQAALRAEQEKQRELEKLTVDYVQPGFEQNERDHHQAGVSSAFGDFGEHKWRDARDGGWFSYELKLDGSATPSLAVTYWGSDGGGREFDILVDGVKIATQRLANNDPQKFFVVKYPLKPSIVNGKQHITVKFQAHPGMMAGGIFDCRVVKSP